MGWITGLEAARRMGRHPHLVYRWLREGRLRGRKFGGRIWMVSEAELSRFTKREPERRNR
jgi:excisionase family DNA binding protein